MMHMTTYITGKTPCKYGPVFAPYLHDRTLYGINTVKNGSVFTWHFSCVYCYSVTTHLGSRL